MKRCEGLTATGRQCKAKGVYAGGRFCAKHHQPRDTSCDGAIRVAASAGYEAGFKAGYEAGLLAERREGQG